MDLHGQPITRTDVQRVIEAAQKWSEDILLPLKNVLVDFTKFDSDDERNIGGRNFFNVRSTS